MWLLIEQSAIICPPTSVRLLYRVTFSLKKTAPPHGPSGPCCRSGAMIAALNRVKGGFSFNDRDKVYDGIAEQNRFTAAAFWRKT